MSNGIVQSPNTEGAIEVRDGRRLGYAEYGSPTGRALLWFHGTPGARGQLHSTTSGLAAQNNVRVVTVERPGIGDSTPHLYGSVVDFVPDIELLTKALGIDRFAVAGLSGGGPYTLACAHELPDRVVAAAVLGGVAPSKGVEAPSGGITSLTRYLEPVLSRGRGVLGRSMARVVQTLAPAADPAMNLFLKIMPPGDAKVFADLGTRRAFQQDLIRGSEGGMECMFSDLTLFGRAWDFSLRDIKVPVHFWHGDADTFVPLSHSEHMASLIEDSALYVRPEEGHLGSLGATPEIIAAMLSHW